MGWWQVEFGRLDSSGIPRLRERIGGGRTTSNGPRNFQRIRYTASADESDRRIESRPMAAMRSR